MNDVFAEVARMIREAWSRKGFRVAAFPEVASRALQDVDPSRCSKPDLLAGALARINHGLHRACYHDATNVVPVYADDQFILTFHMWEHTFGNPHSHGWSGAFQSLSDPVVYADFVFELGDPIDNDFQLGARTQTALRVLRRGDVVPVEQGVSIHGFGHVGLPGLTLAARSRNGGGRTYDYWGMWLRTTNDPRDEVAHDARLRARMVRALRRLGEDAFRDGLRRTLSHCSLRASVLVIFDLVASRPIDAPELADLVCQAHRLDGELETAIRGALEDKAFHEHALTLFETCHEPKGRFLASALRFSETRPRLEQLVAEGEGLGLDITSGSLVHDLVDLLSAGGFLPTSSMGGVLCEVLGFMLSGASKPRIAAELERSHHAASIEDAAAMLMGAIGQLPLTRRIMPELP